MIIGLKDQTGKHQEMRSGKMILCCFKVDLLHFVAFRMFFFFLRGYSFMLCQWPGCRQHLGHPLVSDDKYASEQLEKAGVGVEGPQWLERYLVRVPSLVYIVGTGWGPSVMFVVL
jgi:hypothetical protein